MLLVIFAFHHQGKSALWSHLINYNNDHTLKNQENQPLDQSHISTGLSRYHSCHCYLVVCVSRNVLIWQLSEKSDVFCNVQHDVCFNLPAVLLLKI